MLEASAPTDQDDHTPDSGAAIVRGGLWLWLQEGSEMVLAFAFTWLALRHLGAAGYGSISLNQSILNVAALGTLNFELALIHYIPDFRARQQWLSARRVVWLVTILKMALASLTAVALFLLAPQIAARYPHPNLTLAIRIGCLSLFATALINVGKALCLGWLRPDLRAGLSIMRRFLEIGGLSLAILLGLNVVYAVAVLALADALTAIAFGFVAFKLLRRDPTGGQPAEPSATLARRVARFSLPLVGSQITEVTNQNIGRLILGLFVSPEMLGLYSIARLMTDRLSLLMSQFPLMAVPVIAQAGDSDSQPGRVQTLIARLLQIQWGLGSLLTLAICTAAPLIALLLGHGNNAALISLLRLLSVVVLLWAGTAVLHAHFLIRERTGGILLLNFGQFTLLILCYLVLVPRAQEVGAALADIIAQTFELLFGLWLVQRWFGFRSTAIFPSLLKQFALVFLLIVPLWLLEGWWPIFWGTFALVIFTAYLLRTGLPSAAELAWLEAADWRHPALNRAKTRFVRILYHLR